MPLIRKINQMNLPGHSDQELSLHPAACHINELYSRTWINRHALNGLLLTCRYWLSWYRSSKGTIPTELTTDVDGLKHITHPVSPNVPYLTVQCLWKSDYFSEPYTLCRMGIPKGQVIYGAAVNEYSRSILTIYYQSWIWDAFLLFFTLLTVHQIHNLEVSTC